MRGEKIGVDIIWTGQELVGHRNGSYELRVGTYLPYLPNERIPEARTGRIIADPAFYRFYFILFYLHVSN